MNQFYYFDGMIYPVLATAIEKFTQPDPETDNLVIRMGNASIYSIPLYYDQYNKIANKIVNQLCEGRTIIDIGNIINEEFHDKVYHVAV